jgi:8-oxo-dGTP pyrophosphatase MutT (NUDIX family)
VRHGTVGRVTDPVMDVVRTAVRARTPIDAREERSLTVFLEVVDTLADPCSEHASGRHVTASAIVVGPRGVVLHRHKRLGIWLQPGGHIDPGETPWDAAVREAAEETGLPVRLASPELVHVDVHPGPRCEMHLDLRYLVEAEDVEPSPGADESPDVRWMSWDEAIEVADEGLRGALVALSRGRGSPAPR